MILNCGQTWSRQINFGSFSFSNMKELKKTQQWYPIYKIQNIFGFKPDLSSKYYFLQILLPLYFVIIIFRFKYQSQKVRKKLPLKLQLKAEKKVAQLSIPSLSHSRLFNFFVGQLPAPMAIYSARWWHN